MRSTDMLTVKDITRLEELNVRLEADTLILQGQIKELEEIQNHQHRQLRQLWGKVLNLNRSSSDGINI